MSVAEEIRELAGDVSRKWKRVRRSEAATKTSLILPFIAALGYDIHEPDEFDAEFLADVGTKKHEKVDYAVIKGGKPIILIECKKAEISLGKEHLSQLLRYYAVTDARFAILTNGVEYQFYTDLRKRNVMDDAPFLIVNMLDLSDDMVVEVARFSKSGFDAQAIWNTVFAREIEQRDLQTITDNISCEFASPSRDLVKILAKGVLGKGVQKRAEWARVTQLTKRALDKHVESQATAGSDGEKDLAPARTEEEIRKKRRHDAAIKAAETRRHNLAMQQSAEELDYSKYEYWEQLKANPELHNLYEKLREYVDSLGREVQINPTKYYISFRRRRAAIYFKFRPGKSLMYLFVNADLERISLQEGFTRKLLKSMSYPPCNVEITIRNHDDLERAKPLIKRSYDEAG